MIGLRAPEFWRRAPPTPLALVLSPLAAIYGAAAARRLSRPGPRADLPTILVGGLTAGGDGKTPVALALAALLQALGERPAFLTRGFGRRAGLRREPFLVDPARDGAAEAGDEALLLARRAPTIVAADRLAAARLARELGATALILDDGLQSRALAADLAIAVVDRRHGAGNGLCLPAGPLRAPLASQIAAVDAIVAIGEGEAGRSVLDRAAAAGRPIFGARAALDPLAVAGLSKERLVAFAGIARPEKFFASLREAGLAVVGERRFADHHAFSEREIAALRREAGALGARLATTEKDAARLSASAARDIAILPLSVELEEPAAVAAALRRALDQQGDKGILSCNPRPEEPAKRASRRTATATNP
jgi:tetraacyldisaccharide 4'-kinase